MTLIAPLNDKQCLSKLHAEVQRRMQLPVVRAIAHRFASLSEFIRYIRGLDQRDDLGDPCDGPRLPCEISQRTRFNPKDPNCWERTYLYLAIAEILAPGILRSSASLLMNGGWHTFPVEFYGGLPRVVTLDPLEPPPNNMLATAYQARNLSPIGHKVMPRWFLDMARNACIEDGGAEQFDNAIRALRNALVTGEPIDDAEDREDLDYVLELAAQDSELWGERGEAAYDEIRQSIRNLGFKLDGAVFSNLITKLADVGQKLAPEAIKAALMAEFGPAAAIALQGVDLGFAGGGQKAQNTTQAQTPSDGTSGGSQPSSKASGASRVPHLRRMTLGFRKRPRVVV